MTSVNLESGLLDKADPVQSVVADCAIKFGWREVPEASMYRLMIMTNKDEFQYLCHNID